MAAPNVDMATNTGMIHATFGITSSAQLYNNRAVVTFQTKLLAGVGVNGEEAQNLLFSHIPPIIYDRAINSSKHEREPDNDVITTATADDSNTSSVERTVK